MKQRLILLAILFTLIMSMPVSVPAAPGNTVYLPLIFRDHPANTIFGIEMSQVSATTGLDLVLTSGTGWVRRNAMLWSEIEPIEGAGYRWDAPSVQRLEAEMLAASAGGLKLILVVRSSPTWAVAPYTAECGPINPVKRAAFARFMAAAVERYSRPPYNVRYWELGNEPDATLIADDFVYGCWGIEGDPYYGGREYGEALKAAYPAMKRANPDIQVLNGGLLLDHPYDPQRPTDTAGRFFEGMLVAGAGRSFDIVSYHTYNHYSTGAQPFGPPYDWRIPYLRDLLQRYGIPPKPLMRTETGLLCVQVTPECRWAQADYVARTFVYAMRDGLSANLWYVYDNDSYHHTALIEPGDVFVPRPAYFAFRHTARTLSGSEYLGGVPGLPDGVSAYRFSRGQATIVVYWTDTDRGLPFSLDLPAGAQLGCTDRDGGPTACQTESGRLMLTAQRSPAFVVVN